MDRIAMVHQGRVAFNRGDVDAMLEHYHPDAAIFPITAAGIEGRGFRGHDEIRGYRNALDEVFDKVEIHYEDARDFGHCVVALGHWTIKGRMSGVETTARGGWVVRFRDAKIVRHDSYTDQAGALAAAGVEDWRDA
jgi:ketosteroid isomerase-like protein